MKTIAEFEAFYTTDLLPVLQRLETRRQRSAGVWALPGSWRSRQPAW